MKSFCPTHAPRSGFAGQSGGDVAFPGKVASIRIVHPATQAKIRVRRKLIRSSHDLPLQHEGFHIGTVVATLTDVRELMKHLPADRRARSTWRYVAAQLEAAAAGSVDIAEASIALRIVLMLEGVGCRPN